jgi:hypothetical protein
MILNNVNNAFNIGIKISITLNIPSIVCSFFLLSAIILLVLFIKILPFTTSCWVLIPSGSKLLLPNSLSALLFLKAKASFLNSLAVASCFIPSIKSSTLSTNPSIRLFPTDIWLSIILANTLIVTTTSVYDGLIFIAFLT